MLQSWIPVEQASGCVKVVVNGPMFVRDNVAGNEDDVSETDIAAIESDDSYILSRGTSEPPDTAGALIKSMELGWTQSKLQPLIRAVLSNTENSLDLLVQMQGGGVHRYHRLVLCCKSSTSSSPGTMMKIMFGLICRQLLYLEASGRLTLHEV